MTRVVIKGNKMKHMLIAVFALLVGTSLAEPDTPPIPSQHKPFFVWVEAIKNADLEAFKTAYSAHMLESISKKGAQKVLDNYRKDFKEAFGGFNAEDFTLSFEPTDKKKGKLLIKFKGKKFSGLSIIQEEGHWKLNEY